jgi:indole-3-glycerol phosphate synthase
MVSILGGQVAEYLDLASTLGLEALVEVHDEAELEVAVAAKAPLIGVNSRNLRTLDVDLSACETIGPRIPRDVVGVAESGVKTADDVRRLQAAGFRALLIGERLMTAPDTGAAFAALREDTGTGPARGQET